MIIENITLFDFLHMDDKSKLDNYLIAIQFGDNFKQEEDTLGIGDLTKKPFGLVKDLEDMLQNDNTILDHIELLEAALSTHLITSAITLIDFYKNYNFLVKSLLDIVNAENTHLSAQITNSLESQALYDEHGENLFEGLGLVMQISELANGDPSKYEIIRNTPWETCFTELLIRNRKNKYQTNLNRLRMQKYNSK